MMHPTIACCSWQRTAAELMRSWAPAAANMRRCRGCPHRRRFFLPAENDVLRSAVARNTAEDGTISWVGVAADVPGRTDSQA